MGAGITLAFVALRLWNGYGDPSPWTAQGEPIRTLLSFLNTTKYPPSLDFLAMTLGPALVALALLDRESGAVGRAFAAFGRVPLFFYVAHLALAHAAARLFFLVTRGEAYSPMQGAFSQQFPEWFHGMPLPGVYAAWVAVVVALFPLCAWYADVKRRSASPLLSYL